MTITRTVEDALKESEVAYEEDVERTFNYVANEKNMRSKLTKGAKRDPIQIKDNSSSTNIIFSLGAWCHIVLPLIKHWKSIIGSKIEADRNTIKVADVKTGKDMTGKSIDSQVVFYFNDEKVTLHCFNTSQLI